MSYPCKKDSVLSKHKKRYGFWSNWLRNPFILFYFLFPVLFSSCFDYKEILIFRNDFSGTLELSYRVPLYPEKDRSLIAFLPVQKERLQSRYRRLLRSRQLRIEFFQVEMESTGIPQTDPVEAQSGQTDRSELFRRFAHVRYRLAFPSPLIPVTGGLSDKPNRMVSRMYRLSREFLKDHSMQFFVYFTDKQTLKSNKGNIADDSHLYWKLPLASSLYEKRKIIWNVRLTRNR